MSPVASGESRRAASEYLRELLLKPGQHREIWQQHVTRPRNDVINQLAVAEVIAAHLRSAPSHPGDAQVMPYQLRDLVSGALSGGELSQQTLTAFIDAFELADH